MYVGRNGGHLTPAFFQGVVAYAALYGTEEAVRAIALEQHTASSIVKLIKDTGAEAAVDLVEGGHTTLLFTEPELVASKADYAAAKAAGINVEEVKFLSQEEVKEASVTPATYSLTMLLTRSLCSTDIRCRVLWHPRPRAQSLAAQAGHASLQPHQA